MDILLVILLGLGATATVADGQHEWRRRDQLDQLRRRLGLWSASMTLPGSIDNRLLWIESELGLRPAILARQAAILLGEPWYHHRVYDASRISPFLPWLAWRISKGDAPELVAVLESDHFRPLVPIEGMPGSREADYGKDQAWSDLTRLLDWFEGARPDLFRYTWDQAKAAEYKWFASSIVPYKSAPKNKWGVPAGELVWREPVREDEEGEWIIQRMRTPEDAQSAIKEMTGKYPQTHEVWYSQVYVLQNPAGEPMAIVKEGDRYGRPEQIIMPGLQDWGNGLSSEDEAAATRLKSWMKERWPNVASWPKDAIYMAIVTGSDDEILRLLNDHPSIFSQDEMGRHIGGMIYEQIGTQVRDRWAQLANTESGKFDWIPVEIAETQSPSEALASWIETGKWDHELATKPLRYPYEELPGLLRQYTISPSGQGEGYDLTETTGDEDRVLPWEIRVWDLFRHPSGAELEVKVQGFVLFRPDDPGAWVAIMKQAAQFRPSRDPGTWVTSEDFEEFEFTDIVERWGRDSRTVNTSVIKEICRYNSEFDELVATTSLDEALRYLWDAFTKTLDRAEIEGEEGVDEHFVAEDLIEPREGIEVEDVLEAVRLLE